MNAKRAGRRSHPGERGGYAPLAAFTSSSEGGISRGTSGPGATHGRWRSISIDGAGAARTGTCRWPGWGGTEEEPSKGGRQSSSTRRQLPRGAGTGRRGARIWYAIPKPIDGRANAKFGYRDDHPLASHRSMPDFLPSRSNSHSNMAAGPLPGDVEPKACWGGARNNRGRAPRRGPLAAGKSRGAGARPRATFICPSPEQRIMSAAAQSGTDPRHRSPLSNDCRPWRPTSGVEFEGLDVRKGRQNRQRPGRGGEGRDQPAGELGAV